MIKNLIIDISGVIYESGLNLPIKGSIEAIKKLQKNKLNFIFLTNETEITRKLLVQKLNNIGFELKENDIISPGLVCKDYLTVNNLRPYLLVSKEFSPEFDNVSKNNPNCVVLADAGNNFTYENINKVFKFLISNNDIKLISLGKSKYYQNCNKLYLDVGAYAAALEFSTNKKSIVIGKPSKEYFEIALKKFMDTDSTLMVGDDIESDIHTAQLLGIRGVLVRSGKFRKERDEPHKTIKPFLIVNNLNELVDKILNKEID